MTFGFSGAARSYLMFGSGLAAPALTSTGALAQDLSTAIEPDLEQQADDGNVIIVTGQKIERSLQDTVASVKVFDERTIDEQNFIDLNDVLSTYGIPQIVKRVGDFSIDVGEEINPLGIVITKYQENSTIHYNVSRDLRGRGDLPVFDTVIRQANQIAAAAENQPNERTLKQKYGYGDLAERCIDLAAEFLETLEDL